MVISKFCNGRHLAQSKCSLVFVLLLCKIIMSELNKSLITSGSTLKSGFLMKRAQFGLLMTYVLIAAGCAMTEVPDYMSVEVPSEIVDLKDKYKKPATIQNQQGGDDQAVSSKPRKGTYMMGVGDTLTIIINNVADAVYDVVIRPDGFISLPIIDEVEAAGLTPSQLDDQLTSMYSSRYVDPEVSVLVRTIREPMVYVLGEVRTPGSIPYLNATSAAEAIARVGDMLPTAYEKGVIVIRTGEDGVMIPRIVSAPSLISQDDGAGTFQVTPYMALAATQLEPEDILFVPESSTARFGNNLEQLLKPLLVTGNAANTILGPILQYKVIESLDNSADALDNINVVNP